MVHMQNATVKGQSRSLLSTKIAVAAAQGMCQVMLTAALVGVSNFCEMFEQCCHNGRSIAPCSVQIPCKDVRLANDFYHLTSEDFPVKQYKARIHSTTVCIIHYILPHIISHQNTQKGSTNEFNQRFDGQRL